MATERKWRTDVRLTVDPSRAPRDEERAAEDGTFDVVVFADVDGAGTEAVPARPVRFDRDNFESVLARIAPGWRGTVGGGDAEVSLSFRSLDDLHPDRIVEAIAPLAALLAARRDPAQVAWSTLAAPSAPTPAPQAAEPAPADAPPERSLSLDDLLGVGVAPRRDPAPRSALQPLLERLMAPHLVRVDRAHEAAVIAAVDAALSEHLGAIMGDSAFRRAELRWRSLWQLLAAAESAGAARVWVLPCSKAVLRGHLAEDPEDAPLTAPLFAKITPALLIGDWEFDHSREDVELLAWLGALAERAGAPFLAAASPRLLGCASFVELADIGAGALLARTSGDAYEPWQALRDGAGAAWLALAAPRILARLPYGRQSRPVESFAFEEVARDGDPHETLLWMNPALVIATQILRAFGERGWAFDPRRDVQRIDGLPLFVSRAGGEPAAIPCGEVLLTDRQIEALRQLGILPVCSLRDGPAVALPAMQSLSSQGTALPLGALRPARA